MSKSKNAIQATPRASKQTKANTKKRYITDNRGAEVIQGLKKDLPPSVALDIQQKQREQEPLKHFPFLTVDELREQVRYDLLLSVLRQTDNLAVVKLGHDLASELRRDVEEIIKERLWKEDPPEGEMRFSSIHNDNGRTYFNAKIGNSTRGIPVQHVDDLEEARLEKRRQSQENFVEREKKRQPAAARSNTP